MEIFEGEVGNVRKLVLALLVTSLTVLGITYPSTIKVLLSNSLTSWGKSQGYDFDRVELTSTRPFKIVSGDFEKVFPINSKLVLKPSGDSISVEGENFEKVLGSKVEILPTSKRGLIRILNVKRALGTPEYPGKLIVENIGGKLYVVNEVSIEDYVKRVVPSEMPSSFPKEALKAQAVAARSLAVVRAMNPSKKYEKYGADCDDSIYTQVYNNVEYTPVVEEAVRETEGIVMFYGDEIVNTMVYFSTSSGFTANVEEVWSDGSKFPGKEIPYLRSQPQFEGMEAPDVSKEEVASWFFRRWDWEGVKFYDAQSPWFRWKVTLTREQLENIMSKTIPQRERADKILKADFIKVVEGMSPDDPNFSVGKLEDLRVIKRGKGGNIMVLEIVGSNGRWQILKEYNIRFVIRPRKDFAKSEKDIILHLHNGIEKANYSILPSAFFTMEIKRDENGDIETVTFWGGGNGHGVGMSQYGAKFMGENGYSYEEILKKYYFGVSLKKVY